MRERILSGLTLLCLVGCAAKTAPRPHAASAPVPQPLTVAPNEFLYDLPPIRRADRLGPSGVIEAHATYGQCQIELSLAGDPETSLAVLRDDNERKVESCLAAAAREGVDVLILPELSLAFREPVRRSVLEKIREAARRHAMIVVAGSYYDEARRSRLPVIGPDWEETGYKIRPSRFEASPRYGRGMTPGIELLLVTTRFGRIVPLTCVDLLSDAVQYEVRNLATRGEVDVIANVNFNPAAWEFMIEANGIARRHAVFVSITNAASTPDPRLKEECQKTGDTGYCYGNSALFASLRDRDSDCPNCSKAVSVLIEAPFKSGNLRSLPYDTLVAVVPPFTEAILVYDLNLRLTREPVTTNAPDQGYPTVRNVRRVALP